MTGGPVISYGEVTYGAWCAVCQKDSRLRLALFADGQPAGGLEICPGCGTGHDKPGAYITPEPPGPVVSPPPRGRGLIASLTALVPRRDPDAPVCARRHCAKRSRDVAHDWDDGAGVSIAYRFCSKRCRHAWREENGL
jgi:hypothetical protein